MSETADLSPTIVEALYSEALVLADAARAAFDLSGRLTAASEDEDLARIALSCEALRTTTRMMHAIAWLLNQRAYFAGELSEFQLRRHGRLPAPVPSGELAALPADAAVAGGRFAVPEAIDIRLAFVHCRGRPDLAGRTLHWGPEQGWSMSHRLANRPLCYYASSATEPLRLVPAPPELLDWAVADPIGTACPTIGVRLDDGADAIDRLLTFLDPGRRFRTCVVTGRTDVE
jgi:regulator of CtrA degradation